LKNHTAPPVKVKNAQPPARGLYPSLAHYGLLAFYPFLMPYKPVRMDDLLL